jgi:transposase
MAEIERKTKRYPTDLTDEEWAKIEPLLPKPARTGRRREFDFREILNAIRYMARSGGGWRMLPKDFPPWQTVYWWFRRFVRLLLFRTIHDIALMMDRERQGREASPSGGVLDSQSVKAPAARKRGYDAGKKVVGRKRHIAVDTDGRLSMVNLTPADISDSAGAQAILSAIRKRWPWLEHLFADGAYDRGKLMDKAAFLDFVIEVVRRIDGEPGFKVLPRRWVVERTFGRMTRWRTLVRDYEQRLDVSEAMIHVAMGSLLLRRISHRSRFQTDSNHQNLETGSDLEWSANTLIPQRILGAPRQKSPHFRVLPDDFGERSGGREASSRHGSKTCGISLWKPGSATKLSTGVAFRGTARR